MKLLGISLAALLAVSAAAPAAAHGPGRHRLGVHHDDVLKATENWGTYCVTELAPMFREAIALHGDPRLKAFPAVASTPAPKAVPNSPRLALNPLLVPPQPAPEAQAPKPSSDMVTVFTARKIVTMDPGWPEGTAVAVKDGKILSVGTFEDLKPWLDKFPFEVDDRFKDKVIYPGFIEPHGHPVMGALAIGRPPLSYFPLRNPYGPDFPGVTTKGQAIEKLKEYVAAAKPGETVLTWGYDVVAMGGTLPNRADLDSISTTQPIIVWDASEHYVFANSAAIAKYGVTDEMVANTIGAGHRADGSSDGQFLGTDAAKIILLKPLAELMAPERALNDLRRLGALMQQAGVTTTGDLFYGGVNLPLEQTLARQYFGADNAISRVVHVVDGVTFAGLFGEDAIPQALNMRAGGDDGIIFNGVKFYADDAFVSLGMELEWPGYIHADRYKGLFMFSSKDAFIEAMRPWWNQGFQIHVHSNGSGGNQITLDALAALQWEKPRFDHRFTFEHFGISTVAQGRRVKALGALVSTNPYYVHQRADLNVNQIGTDRASLAARMRSLVDQDVVVSLHSDTPVGVPSPLLEVWIAVNRIGALSNKVRAPYERVDVARAMKMVTVDAAYTLGVEGKLGTIEAGKLADFAVLEQDPQDVDPMAIKDIGVVATILSGRVTLTSETRDPDWGN